MPIVIGGIIPHPPHLLSEDAKNRIPKTADLVQRLVAALKEAKPDTVFLLNSHEPVEKDVFLLNVHPSVTPDLSQFGISKTFRAWKGDLEFSSHLRQLAQDKRFPIQMTTEPLEIATSVPLAVLSELPETTNVLPIHISGLPRKNHMEFGAFLHEEAEKSTQRFAILCSADFSSTADKTYPELYKPEGATFNELAIEAVKTCKSDSLLTMDERIIELAGTCAYEPLLVFFAALADLGKPPKEFTQESAEGFTFVTAVYPI